MKSEARKIAPKIESDEEAGKFWLEHDTTDYVDWSKAERPNRPRADNLFEIEIPATAAKRLTSIAEQRHVTRTALVRKYVLEGLKRDQERARA